MARRRRPLPARMPTLAMPMDAAGENMLACTHLPAAHRAGLHSTSPIGRRTDAVGISPHKVAAMRPAGAILLEPPVEWTIQRARHMALDIIGAVGNNPRVSPPAVTARPTVDHRSRTARQDMLPRRFRRGLPVAAQVVPLCDACRSETSCRVGSYARSLVRRVRAPYGTFVPACFI